MARENGTVLTPPALGTSGTIDRDNDLIPDPVNFTNSAISVKAGDRVSYQVTLDPITGANVAVNLLLLDDAPADEGTVVTGTIPTLTVNAGETVTLKGATVNGNVRVNGGKLIIKTNETGLKTTIGKGLNGNQNARVVFYKSEIQGTTTITNSLEFMATAGNTGSSLILVNNGAISIDGTAVDGDVVVNNSTVSATVKNCNITVNLEMHNNVNCIQVNNTVGGTNSGCAA